MLRLLNVTGKVPTVGRPTVRVIGVNDEGYRVSESWYRAWAVAWGQESRYYQNHKEYCRKRGIPTSEWVRKHNHIKTAH